MMALAMLPPPMKAMCRDVLLMLVWLRGERWGVWMKRSIGELSLFVSTALR
jgi:hypothetical protein